MPDLQDLYREVVLDHYHHPRQAGELPSPPATRAEGFNPLCGDEVVVSLVVQDGVVEDIRVRTQGCSISTSSGSMMAVAVKGRSLAEVRDLIRTFKAMMSIHEASLDPDAETGGPDAPPEVSRLGDLAALQGVVQFPVRIKCATLAWNTLADALPDPDAAQIESDRLEAAATDDDTVSSDSTPSDSTPSDSTS
jgi:nitrogen fixation NifU-like protein